MNNTTQTPAPYIPKVGDIVVVRHEGQTLTGMVINEISPTRFRVDCANIIIDADADLISRTEPPDLTAGTGLTP